MFPRSGCPVLEENVMYSGRVATQLNPFVLATSN